MLTVNTLWKMYEPVSSRHDSYKDDRSRVKHLIRLLGGVDVASLTVIDIDQYRAARFAETTVRGTPPAPGSLDREIELLRRMCGYAVKGRKLEENPMAGIGLLSEPNIRRTLVSEQQLARVAAVDPEVAELAWMAFYTGMRQGEIAKLRWDRVDLDAGCIRLRAEDTKTERGRVIYLVPRALEILRARPRTSDTVWNIADVGGRWRRATRKVGLSGIWFHDTRRTFVTNARRRGLSESETMRFTGHRTRAVFERYNVVDENDLRRAVAVLAN